MPSEKACRDCKRVVERGTDECPNCGSDDFSDNWKGYVIILDPEGSEIAEEMNINKPGKYALRVS